MPLDQVSSNRSMVMLIIEIILCLTLLSAMDSRMSNVVSRVLSFQEDKSKEWQLLEQLLESQESFSWMKLLQLWTKTPKRKFKKLLTTLCKEGLLSSLRIECLPSKVAIRSTSLKMVVSWKKETLKNSKLNQGVSLPTKTRKKQLLPNNDFKSLN